MLWLPYLMLNAMASLYHVKAIAGQIHKRHIQSLSWHIILCHAKCYGMLRYMLCHSVA